MEYKVYKGKDEFVEGEIINGEEIEKKDQTDEMVKYFNDSFDEMMAIDDENVEEASITFECMPLVSTEIVDEISKKTNDDFYENQEYFMGCLEKGTISPKYVKMVFKKVMCLNEDRTVREIEIPQKEGIVDLNKFEKEIKCPLVEANADCYAFSVESTLAYLITNPEQRMIASAPMEPTIRRERIKM